KLLNPRGVVGLFPANRVGDDIEIYRDETRTHVLTVSHHLRQQKLFGHAPEGKKGFFEQANGGSVLLDEIGEMSPRMQAKLLRFL
ncbi:sigma 54-interacting transcriptional regulator, partial [Salmonella enterica subsp. enterica serovar Montevideo]|nr:sigma 54-interacting transcriptional regulator [Salmonella enterica subsp. enterica serovar Montevideo]